MANEENVAEIVQQEEVVQPQVEETPRDQSPALSEPSTEISDKEKNFRRLREVKEQLEIENRELKRRLESPPPPSKKEPLPEGIDVADDDIVEGRVVKKLYNELNQFKKAYEKEKAATVPDRLKAKFSDFNQVVTLENVEKLKQTEPELYESISAGKDPYAVGVSAYKTLKALNIVKEDPYKPQKEQVHNNQTRPLSTQAIKGQGALSDANIFAKGLTPELKKQLREEMNQAVKAR